MPEPARDIAGLALVVAVTTAITGLLGAANLGTALSFGELAFAVALVLLILRR